MTLANFLDLGHGSLVGKHGQIGPHVVLDLVVQPSVEEIDKIGSGGKVGRGNDLTQVEGSTAGTAAHSKGVQIVTSVVGGNDDKGVNVGKHIGKEESSDCVEVPSVGRFRVEVDSGRQQWQRKDEKSVEKVGHEDTSHEATESDPRRKLRAVHGHVGKGHGSVKVVVLFLEGLGVGLADFLHTQLLVGVGCVVPPFPDAHDNIGGQVLDKHGGLDGSQKVQVAFDQIGIRALAQVVVMQIIMFHIPRLGKHPVEPVEESAPDAANSKAEAVESSGFLAVIVPSVAGVVGNHGPAGCGSNRQTDSWQNVVVGKSHTGKSHQSEHVGPQDHLVQVGNIRGSLFVGETLSKLLNVLAECFQVHLVDPLVILVQSGFASGLVVILVVVDLWAFTWGHGGLLTCCR